MQKRLLLIKLLYVKMPYDSLERYSCLQTTKQYFLLQSMTVQLSFYYKIVSI